MEIQELDGVRLDCCCGDEDHIVFIQKIEFDNYVISFVGDWRKSLWVRIKEAMKLIFKNPFVYHASIILDKGNIKLIQDYLQEQEK